MISLIHFWIDTTSGDKAKDGTTTKISLQKCWKGIGECSSSNIALRNARVFDNYYLNLTDQSWVITAEDNDFHEKMRCY